MFNPNKILLVKLSSLGDIIHSLHLLDVLRRSYPSSQIHWVVSNRFETLLKDHPQIDRLHIFQRDRWSKLWRHPTRLREIISFLGNIRRERYDLVIDLQGLFRSGLISWVSRASQRIGFDSRREMAHWFYNQRVLFPHPEIHAVERNLKLLTPLEISSEAPNPVLPIDSSALKNVDQLLSDHQLDTGHPLVAIFPTGRWASKVWPLENVASACEMLCHHGLRPLILGAPDEKHLSNQLKAHTECDFIDLIGVTNLPELIALISKIDLLIGHDSGPMHIASVLRTPVIALFGPSTPIISGPYDSPGQTLQNTELDCLPCMERQCPLQTLECMRQLTGEHVAQTALEILGISSTP